MSVSLNSKPDHVEINIFGKIGADMYDDQYGKTNLLNDLQHAKDKDVVLNISSLGGDANEAMVIYDHLKSHNGKVTAKVFGLTASAGTLIAMSASKVIMSKNAQFLVHVASANPAGTAKHLRDVAKDLDWWDEAASKIYAKKTGKPQKDLLKLMQSKRGVGEWLSAQEALEWGFVDEIFEASEIVSADYEMVNNSKLLPNVKPYMDSSIVSMDESVRNGPLEGSLRVVLGKPNMSKQGILEAVSEMAQTVNQFKKEQREAREDEADKLIKSALKAGKIAINQKEVYTSLLSNDFENGKKVLESLPERQLLGDTIISDSSPENKANWTLDQWRKYDPKYLMQNPDFYQELIERSE